MFGLAVNAREGEQIFPLSSEKRATTFVNFRISSLLFLLLTRVSLYFIISRHRGMLLEWEHSFSPRIRATRYTQLKYVIKSRQIFIACSTRKAENLSRIFN
jgi:hypothetical protein